tara:strand:+ start:703 stop:825 length:123 start_codon:yes stop_codon:yes gene_type:complete
MLQKGRCIQTQRPFLYLLYESICAAVKNEPLCNPPKYQVA